MEGGLLSETDFAKQFGNKVVLFCHVTSRIPDRKYDGLLRKFGGTGFPTVFFLDESGELLVKHAGERTIAGFSGTLSSVEAYSKAKKRVAAGEESAAADLLFAEMQLGKIRLEAAKARGGKLELDAKQKRLFRGLLASLEFDAAVKASRPSFKRGMTREEYLKLYQDGMKKRHATVVEMVVNGRIPVGARASSFWVAAAQAGDVTGAPDLARRAIKEANKLEVTGAAKRFLDRIEAKLDGKEVPAPVRTKAIRMVPIKAKPAKGKPAKGKVPAKKAAGDKKPAKAAKVVPAQKIVPVGKDKTDK